LLTSFGGLVRTLISTVDRANGMGPPVFQLSNFSSRFARAQVHVTADDMICKTDEAHQGEGVTIF
jgi:hypothetical protein